jgi:hypothetical protein
MGNILIEQVRVIQDSMVEFGREHLPEAKLEHLRVLIRLTIEFHYYLQSRDIYSAGEPIDPSDQKEVNYRCDSILGGMESFLYFSGSYHLMSTSMMTAWDQMSIETLKGRFASIYEQFSVESDFERRCGLLLDLFKLQIVFVGLSYR